MLDVGASSAGKTSHHTFVPDGSMEREFWLHRPSCSRGGRLPLVLMLHGWGERGSQYAGVAQQTYGWREGADRWTEEADRACFNVAWPQGLSTQLGSRKRTSWNGGGCSTAGASLCSTSSVERSYGGSLCSRESCGGRCDACAWCSCADDVGFLTQLTMALRADAALRVDPQRIFLAGCSNGGMMVWEMALHGPPGLFAAFVANCGLPHRGLVQPPSRALSLLQIHATNDGTIPSDGSPDTDGGWVYETVEDALSAAEHPTGAQTCESASTGWISLRDAIDASHSNALSEADVPWLSALDFGPRPATRTASDGTCRAKARCAGGAIIAHCTGTFGHDWPGWAAAVAWRFFVYAAEQAALEPTTLEPPALDLALGNQSVNQSAEVGGGALLGATQDASAPSSAVLILVLALASALGIALAAATFRRCGRKRRHRQPRQESHGTTTISSSTTANRHAIASDIVDDSFDAYELNDAALAAMASASSAEEAT
jgi:poly(3-hydroxybutyrate) depolymerase